MFWKDVCSNNELLRPSKECVYQQLLLVFQHDKLPSSSVCEYLRQICTLNVHTRNCAGVCWVPAHQRTPLRLSASAHVFLCRYSVCGCESCFSRRIKRPQRWDLPDALQPLPAHTDTPSGAGFCPTQQSPGKAGHARRPELLSGPPHLTAEGMVPGSWEKALNLFCAPPALRHPSPSPMAYDHVPSQTQHGGAGTLTQVLHVPPGALLFSRGNSDPEEAAEV